MIQITPQMRIFVALEDIDFRKGIDGLAAACRQRLRHDPFSGMLFLFRNKQRSALKILVYDGQGFWLCTKRLSKGKFHWWPQQKGDSVSIQAHDLQTLLWNGDPGSASFSEAWRKI
jgi:transposase